MPVTPRKVIVTQGGIADPNQEYERMILYNEDGSHYSPPAGGVGPVTPEEAASDLLDGIGSHFCLVSADTAVQLTVKGTCHANASGDLGRLVLMISGDDGATGTEIDQFATTSPTDVPMTLSGIVPAGWKAIVQWLQNAPGQGGTYYLPSVITQTLN